MKVVEETRTRLVIKHRPIADWLWGSVLFIGGLSFWIYFIVFDFASLHLTCTRFSPPEINCELRRFKILRSMEKINIYNPQQAYIQEKIGSKGSKSYQVIIVSNLKHFPLLSHISYQDNQAFMIKFNSFINSSDSFLILRQNQRDHLVFVSLFMLFIAGIGAYSAMSSATNCTFYKSINKFYIERKSLHSKEIIEYPLEEIVRFHIHDKQDRYSKVYQAVISLKDGKEIPINPQYTDEQSVRYVVMKIRQFLNVDL
ncbi:hypothetical protein [Anabaena catenula]|uniref:Uncharacterized protein n=1 Tax=Anabaena catenula FACHB-362 TaxID=2692877 RepID=A0ABR8J5B6_9NOST|nr:hypothetical protein [Anabaena catenula]MBD2693557.1 hypothetical protein [Anabaena catenula FACHB-362]